MALQFRKVTEEQRLTITPVIGEPLYTIDTKKFYIGDGVTVGGISIISSIAVQDYFNVDLQDGNIKDGDFLYYDATENKWKLGKHALLTSDLIDVTPSTELDQNFMIVYNADTDKWVIREELTKALGDVNGIDVTTATSGNQLLEYNAITGNFEAKPIPPRPGIGDLLGISVNEEVRRGHVFTYDPVSSEYLNGYISTDQPQKYYADLYEAENLDYIAFNSTTERFEKKTPFLKDVDLVSISGLGVVEPVVPIVFTVKYSTDSNRFLVNNASAPILSFFVDSVYRFDLSDASLIGKTFNLSTVFDGIHSIDPPGEIIDDSTRITINGTPGIDGELLLDLRIKSPLPEGEMQWKWQFDDEFNRVEIFYFCVEEPELGNRIDIDFPRFKPYVLQWDALANTFDVKKFNYKIDDLENVVITTDEEGFIFNQQMLAYDAGNNVWTTPGDRVPGVGIGASLPRTRTRYSNALWEGGIRGLGSFDLELEDGEELKDITIKLNELEMEGEDQEFDAYMFDSEEDREEFYEMLEQAEAALGPGGILSPEAIEELVEEFSKKGRKVKRSRLKANVKKYVREGKSVPANAKRIYVEEPPGSGGDGGGASGFGSMPLASLSLALGGGGGGGGAAGDGSGDSDGDGYADGLGSEPGLDDFGFGFPSPEEEAEAFRDAYKNFAGNLKKIFGALLARNRALKQLMPNSFNQQSGGGGLGDLLGGGVEVQYNVVNMASEGLQRMMLGWRASTDVYGYYYFTFTQRSSVLTYNSRHHFLDVQSCMRRCACILNKQTTFRVVFYYDADDSRFIAGPWLRIVEWQNPISQYTGELQEYPSLNIRNGLPSWDRGTKYQKGTRVIHNDKVWECLLEFAEGIEPGPGTTPAPTVVDGQLVYPFVEIPKFTVKSQVFEGVYQMRCLLGLVEGKETGGYTHPVFNFGSENDDADFLYVAANLETFSFPSGFNVTSTSQLKLNTRTGWRNDLALKNFDIGVFQYDILVHSALQHLMVHEFQTFNIERRLGEANTSATVFQSAAENFHSVTNGNKSFCTQPGQTNEKGNIAEGIPCYRGIFRPYGNQGYLIDGLNVNAATGAASFNRDFSTHTDSGPEPVGYTFLENLPKPVLNAQGYGASFLSNFYTYRRSDFSDFVFMLPKTLGGGRDSFLGDRIKYRNAPTTNTLLVPSCGSPYQSPINQVQGEHGIFNFNLQPVGLNSSVMATRWCVKRRGKSLTPKTVKTGELDLGSVTDAEGRVIAKNITPAEAAEQGLLEQPGATWNYEKTIDVVETVPGNDRASGEAGTATASLERIVSSRSAVCIGLCDESSLSPTFMDGQWSEFREKFPDREHWLLVPSESDPQYTKPFPSSRLDYGDFTNYAPPTSGDGSLPVVIGVIPALGDGSNGVIYIKYSDYGQATGANLIPDNQPVEIVRFPLGTGEYAGYEYKFFTYAWRTLKQYPQGLSWEYGSLIAGVIFASPISSQHDADWKAMAYSPDLNRIVAVATDANNFNVAYSDNNGRSWQSSEIPYNPGGYAVNNGPARWHKVIWVPGINLFVAISTRDSQNLCRDRIATSPDGITWTLRYSVDNYEAEITGISGSIGNAECVLTDIAYSPELNWIVVVWDSRTNTTKYRHVMTSSDGITWTLRQLPVGSELWNCITWSGELGRFVILSGDSSDVSQGLTSPDGITWTKRILNGVNGIWNKVIWSDALNKFVAVSSGGNYRVMSSVDGINWTGANINSNNINNALWRSVAYSPTLDLLVAVANTGNLGGAVMTSEDGGGTWRSIDNPGEINKWSDVIWLDSAGEFVACAEFGRGNRFMTSSDGLSWVVRSSYTTNFNAGDAPFIPPKLRYIHLPTYNTDFDLSASNQVEVYPQAPTSDPLQPFNPVSRAQKTSLPLTFSVSHSSYNSIPTVFRNNLVWIANPEMGGSVASLEDKTLTIRYKIRIPSGIENLAQSIKILGGADTTMTATIRNPLNNQSSTWTWTGFSLETGYYTITQTQIDNVLAPTAIHENNQWLDLTVTIKNDPLSSPAAFWSANPSAYSLMILTYINGSEVMAFNAREWAEIPHTLYGGYSLWSVMLHSERRAIEAGQGGFNYGPLPVTRDNGNPTNLTDWFQMCRLDTKLPGTLIGLFIDRSGSMTQSTIDASYSYFYQRCSEAGLRIIEVQNNREDWITPFIDEI